MEVQIKRIYETPAASDGYRILVDRIWPRGMSKEKADVGLWLKEIAPTNELRKWFGHDPAKWQEFHQKYEKELTENAEAVDRLKAQIKKGKTTLVYSAKDEIHNQAVVIRDFLKAGS